MLIFTVGQLPIPGKECHLFNIYPYQRDNDMVYPSLGTCVNDKTNIEDDDDLDQLLSELSSFPNEKILQRHTAARLRSGGSGLQIKEVLAMKCYIRSYEYDLTNALFD